MEIVLFIFKHLVEWYSTEIIRVSDLAPPAAIAWPKSYPTDETMPSSTLLLLPRQAGKQN